MLLAELIARIGPARFATACQEATRTAPSTGRPSRHPGEGDPIGDLADEVYWILVEELDTAWERVELLCQLYQEMPSYAVLANLEPLREGLSESEERALLRWYRQTLSSTEPALADPVSYYLWCHDFESSRAARAWNELLSGERNEQLLERLLVASGPVPWDVKRQLYNQLLPMPRWHPQILSALWNSAHDVLGKIDAKEALHLLDSLSLPQSDDSIEQLRGVLCSRSASGE